MSNDVASAFVVDFLGGRRNPSVCRSQPVSGIKGESQRGDCHKSKIVSVFNFGSFKIETTKYKRPVSERRSKFLIGRHMSISSTGNKSAYST